ncbi:MAG: hypothetical protein K0R50_318 [Eubacterium sp.]|jgi:hypothetical protein|nr:hypothetical protein [Eubacterium sp.]
MSIQQKFLEAIPLLIVIALLIFALIFCIFMVVRIFQLRNQAKFDLQRRMIESGAYFNAVFNHAIGLPVSEGTLCKLFLCPDKVEIECCGNKFNLDKSKITDVCIKTDIEIQTQYVSSIGDAVAGAAMFGTLGAIVGGRAKEKELKTVNTYLIFTYIKDTGINYISFDVTHAFFQAQKFVDDFKILNKELNSVDL